MTHYSYCEFHLGDNAVHLHFLRHLAIRYPERTFIHAMHVGCIEQLSLIVGGLPNVSLMTMEDARPSMDAIPWRNVWKNAGAGTPSGGFWESHRFRHLFAEFYLDWFYVLAAEMGLESPFSKPTDLLFDYPALEGVQGDPYAVTNPETILLINSQPCSGQFKPYDGPDYFRPMIRDIQDAGRPVITTERIPGFKTRCTRDWSCSITAIGRISHHCAAVVGIATGPIWPCLNRRNIDKPTIVMLDHVLGDESLESLKPNLWQVKSREAALELMKAKGLL